MGKIDCRNLWKVFGPRPQSVFKGQRTREELLETGHIVAVKDVSFEVQAGEIFVVMGLSGSGKSTLVRCLTRLIEPTSGSILVNGEDVLHMNKKQLRNLRLHQISMVFQRFGLFPHRRVIDNVAYGLEVQGIDKSRRNQRAHEIIDLVGLRGWDQHYPHELSGGMQQRVGLARALAVDPEILLCDEPFSALDPLIRREMQDEVLRLQKLMNKTMIFITHDFYEAVRLGSHIAIMKDGEIVQIGTPQQIMNHPADEYVREFTRDIPRAKVLTASTIMKLWQPSITTGKVCSPETTLEELLPISLVDEQPILVVDEQRQPLGYVDREAMSMALEER
ncbi:MAG: glycine betaine/L-proline ABC transporter ATP-binding protein [Burkholderiales bacterium]|nr:glycine betaine/L-proline ABC transporter ATP-binding protein [Anaerolineae bacterium]